MLNSKEFKKHISKERQYRWKKYLCEPIAKYLKQGVLLLQVRYLVKKSVIKDVFKGPIKKKNECLN